MLVIFFRKPGCDIIGYIFISQSVFRNTAVALKFSFNAVKPAMERERAKLRPAIPHSLQELAAALENYEPTRNCYRGSATATDGSVGLLFASDDMLEALSTSVEVYMDGTFKVYSTYILKGRVNHTNRIGTKHSTLYIVGGSID